MAKKSTLIREKLRRFFWGQLTDRIGYVFGALIIVSLALVALFHLVARPTIVGTWQTNWAGDSYGVTTVTFEKDGRYELSTTRGVASQHLTIENQDAGTYTYADGRLTLRPTASLVEYLDSNRNVEKTVRVSHPAQRSWSGVELSGGGFVLGTPDGMPPTGDPPHVFKRKRGEGRKV